MTEYIDREKDIEIIKSGGYWEREDMEVAIACIEQTPTADVVDVVRCKDCKRCYEKRTKRNNQLMRFCMRIDGNEYQVNANDFCSYGTPKERGADK